MANLENIIAALTEPSRLFSRENVLAKPSPVPKQPGLYAWYFRKPPPEVPTEDCIYHEGLPLLYVGISPRNAYSKEQIQKRIRYHYRGNAEGSTLRLTLGVLLSEESNYPLRRVGSGKRMTFTHQGEKWLDDWMGANALVTWVEYPRPWELEAQILRRLALPLNIQDNSHHSFAMQLSQKRRAAKMAARETPVAREDNQQRQ